MSTRGQCKGRLTLKLLPVLLRNYYKQEWRHLKSRDPQHIHEVIFYYFGNSAGTSTYSNDLLTLMVTVYNENLFIIL